MPAKLTYDYVVEVIKSKGCELLSKEYVSNTAHMTFRCGKCQEAYEQTFDRFTRGYYHPLCKYNEKKPFGGYKKQIILQPLTCPTCNMSFQPKSSTQKLCSLKCRRQFEQREEYKRGAKENGRKGGQVSATRQSRRSQNEIYFSELCAQQFEITTNEPYFEGWDADVIIHSHKLAILWNGIWHYKQISKTQSLKQVQARDRVKLAIIEKHGYTPYIIVDMGKHDKQFVEQEFETFLFMRMEI
jgi:hypothetical protein